MKHLKMANATSLKIHKYIYATFFLKKKKKEKKKV